MMKYLFSLVVLIFGVYSAKADTSFQSLLSKAQNGNQAAYRQVGIRLFDGIGVEANGEEAYKWLYKALEAGDDADGEVYYYLALCCIDFSKPGFYEMALDLLKNSAERRYTNSYCFLGTFYENGYGTERDSEQAFNWFKKADEAGDPLAASYLATYYAEGIGGAAKDPQRAFKLRQNAPEGLPQLDWAENTATSLERSFNLKLNIKSESKVDKVDIWINDELCSGFNPVRNNGRTMVVERSLPLQNGNNKIRIDVTNASGSSSIRREIKFYDTAKKSSSNERRIALVVGNGKYMDEDKCLNNPVNDATDIALKLEALGFEVICALDQTHEELDKKVLAFGKQAYDYDVALFYYAGHGISCNNSNYLVPVDAKIEDEASVPYRCTSANMVLDALENSGCPMNVVILDACRNNPFARSWSRGASSTGLVQMASPAGTYIAYSTNPGNVARDGVNGEKNSPFSKALVDLLDVPNLEIDTLFKHVRSTVMELTGDSQVPFSTSSLRGDFIFNKQ